MSEAPITLIDEHPIPIDENRAADLQRESRQFDADDELLHPDELHARYMDVLGENDTWRVFRSGLVGHEPYVFAWNHQLGYGLRFYDREGAFREFVHAMMDAAEVVA